MHLKATRRSYDTDNKLEAVRLAIERNNVMPFARDLGASSTTVKRSG